MMAICRAALFVALLHWSLGCADEHRSDQDASPSGDGGDGDDSGDTIDDEGATDGSDDVLRISGAMPGLVEVGQSYRFAPSTSGLAAADLVFEIENGPAWASFD